MIQYIVDKTIFMATDCRFEGISVKNCLWKDRSLEREPDE